MSNNTTVVEASVKTLNFDGDEDSFRTWKSAFLARSALLGYREALLSSGGVPTAAEIAAAQNDTGTALTLGQTTAMARNTKAYAHLVMCTYRGSAFGYVERSITDDIPTGDAALAWATLLDRYE
ncbi:unnamed protein product, partial [Chrysoparadoxa australica]